MLRREGGEGGGGLEISLRRRKIVGEGVWGHPPPEHFEI